VFSGLYQVIKVISRFSNGQFTQDVEMIRLPRQVAFDYVSNNQNNKSSNRDESSQQTQPGLSPPNPNPVPSSLISGGGAPASPAELADTATDQTAGGDQPVSEISNSEPPVESQSQADLRNVKDTASTQPIIVQTEPQAIVNNPPTSFAQAFRQARATFGGAGGSFFWNGKVYQTNVVGEAFVVNPTNIL
jgi:hypothetical protein